MLTSKSDYIELDVAALSSGYFTGEIMPVRANKSTSRLLRWEDLLFLSEARLERRNWKGGYTSSRPNARPSRIVSASEWNAHAAAYPYQLDFRDNSATPSDTYADANNPPTINTMIANVTLEDATVTKGKLSRSAVDAAYRNIAKLTRTIYSAADLPAGKPSIFLPDGTVKYYGHQSSQSGTHSYDYFSYSYQYITAGTMVDGQYVVQDSWMTEYQKVKNQGLWYLEFPYVSHAWAYGSANMLYRSPTSQITQSYSALVKLCDCQVSAATGFSRISLNTFDWAAKAQAACNAVGMPFRSGGQIQRGEYGKIDIRFAGFVIDHAFPASE